ncbi:alpha-galactosidase [Pseudogracilibacillus auburnensis]|uniref:alpha-galactosidase n=1 Tax=Pseudogracilibacillus auburnensis TaxID=1494959 RepID=UPI001A95B4DE|nr:alpha-galactosidase [Pseudogracilibacillus auburnensis]MBO1004760.1 alpha-galactosidase [Pseudogracilibacillus auburnensis]
MINGFIVEIDNKLFSEVEGFRRIGVEEKQQSNTSFVVEEFYTDKHELFLIKSQTVSYRGSAIKKRCIELTNQSLSPVRLTRMDSIHGVLPKEKYILDYYESYGGGTEFTPHHIHLEATKTLESVSGRSSHGMHPWFTLRGSDESVLGAAVAWSGNWIFRFESDGHNTYRISGGLNNWEFSKVLQPGESVESVEVVYAFLEDGGIDEVSNEFGRWGKQFWYPQNEISQELSVAWNHWWPYEDSGINEDIFKKNVDEAADLGIDICVLDAGWFGEPNPDCNDHLGWSETVDWYLKRGDWHKINTLRFPSGIRALSDYVHSKRMKFGIWCEIEALGDKADLNVMHPELPALRNGKQLGYVCLGNPEARKWAFNVLEKLIVEYKADWIKLDFNLDPKAGCNRTDHGHGEGDGLFEHYKGYYELLTMVREKYPDVYLENCSSGGLRMDLGLARHTHGAFLSDPDHTCHHFHCFWGASQMLHPSACYHFSWSQTIVHYESNLVQDPIPTDMEKGKFDYIMRANMLNSFGISYRLPDLSGWQKERLTQLIHFYKSKVRRFTGTADMYRLTGQTIRNGEGETWNAYLFVTKDKNEGIAFVFRLPGSEPKRILKLEGLDTNHVYEVRFKDNGNAIELTGQQLMQEGINFESLDEERSEVIHLIKI